MTEKSGFSFPHTRRSVVAAAGGAGLAAVLTACGGSGDDSSGSSGASAGGTKAPAGSPSAAGGSGDTSGNGDASGSTPDSGAGATPGSASGSGSASASGSGGGPALAKTSEIPVGGGKVFADQKVVVTQPTAGRFQGFSAVCTHQGCTVSDVSGGTINCPCHGSRFHVADGSVAAGPAVSPLPSKPVKVSGSEITLA
ncbi:Rieske (2Fe-2S) protein [Streptomyces sp. HPF1205]|uniref:Rieske (2Fe-2S) protein n=1 Tax=Streptomyces sp. HPF1205 TaxID=2873262 RepID=UPI001CECC7A0|nr:Rieske (2Fe-2S) protein [Streptomyces sp. HPF1205]